MAISTLRLCWLRPPSTVSRRSNRLRNNTSPNIDYLIGHCYCAYRIKENNGDYVRWDPDLHWGRKKDVDSIVHWFAREKGFTMGDDDELIGDDFLSLVCERLKNIPTYPKSEKNRVLSQRIFENYVLATQTDNHVYKNFLQKIQNPDEVSEQVVFQKPSNLLLQGYLLYMLDGVDVGIGHVKGRNNKYNSVRT